MNEKGKSLADLDAEYNGGVQMIDESLEGDEKDRFSTDKPAFEPRKARAVPLEPGRKNTPEFPPLKSYARRSEKPQELSAGMVAGATTIEDLISKVKDTQRLPGVDMASRIQNFNDFLGENMAELQISVILEQTEGVVNKKLTSLLNDIPAAFGLQKKVKDLMREKWNKDFVKNKDKVMEKAIAQTNSVQELCAVISQFKVIRIRDQSEERPLPIREYEPAEVIDAIQEAKKSLNDAVRAGDFPEVDIGMIGEKISSVLPSAKVPAEYGIYSKASQLISAEVSQAIKDKKLADFSSSSSEEGKSGGWFKKVRGWFSRNK